jgi:hypothetical protein
LIFKRKLKDRLAAVSPKSHQMFLSGGCDQSGVLPLPGFGKQTHQSQASAEKRGRRRQRRLGNYDIIFKLDKVIVHRAPVPRSDPAHGDFPSRARGR